MPVRKEIHRSQLCKIHPRPVKASHRPLTRSCFCTKGTFKGTKPTQYTVEADALAANIIRSLWEDWGRDVEGSRSGEVDLYNGARDGSCFMHMIEVSSLVNFLSVNIPMIPELANPGGLEVVWTRVWRNSYGQVRLRWLTNQQST